VPEIGKLEIELTGAIAAVLALPADGKQPFPRRNGPVQVTLVDAKS
jgi:hypothetical protein